MAHLLEADHISKYYGNVVALNDVSAHVDKGEVTCILGDNGAGKSSFIKILSGSHQERCTSPRRATRAQQASRRFTRTLRWCR